VKCSWTPGMGWASHRWTVITARRRIQESYQLPSGKFS
jgi:hypothetical protein